MITITTITFNNWNDNKVIRLLLNSAMNRVTRERTLQTMYPSWHRTQSISVTSVSYEELREQYLQFSVYDFDRFSRNDLIGQVVLKELLDCTDLEQEIEYTMDILCAMQVTNELCQIVILLKFGAFPFKNLIGWNYVRL